MRADTEKMKVDRAALVSPGKERRTVACVSHSQRRRRRHHHQQRECEGARKKEEADEAEDGLSRSRYDSIKEH